MKSGVLGWGAGICRSPGWQGPSTGGAADVYRAPVRAAIFSVFLVFVERRGESGVWLAGRIGQGHERCLTAVMHHAERAMRVDRRMSLQASATDVWCACGRGSLTVFS